MARTRSSGRAGSSSGEAEPPKRSLSAGASVAVEAFRGGEQVAGLGGCANRGGVGEGMGWAVVRRGRGRRRGRSLAVAGRKK
jgi:hypothetical protein